MPLRNLLILCGAAMFSLLCYIRADRNQFTPTFLYAFREIDEKYVEEVDQRSLYEGAVRGMLGQLDQNSQYTSPEEYRRMREGIDQEFGGIGILVEMSETTKRITVRSRLHNTPAHRAGLRSGDTILKIDDRDTLDLSIDDAVKLMRGAIGSPVKLLIQRGNAKPEPYELQRERVQIESVLGDLRGAQGKWDYRIASESRFGLIRILQFGGHTSEEFEAAVNSLTSGEQPLEGLVIDLRSNPGGLLDEAVKICDLLLDEGVIVTTRGRGGALKSSNTAKPGHILDPEIPIVVLVDQRSASASEIVASCLQDHGRAVICGERTWGKGTVQNIIELEPQKSAMRLTTATYWRPSGKNIHKMREAADNNDDWGVRPDRGFEINVSDEEFAAILNQRRERDSYAPPESEPGLLAPEEQSRPLDPQGKASDSETPPPPRPERDPTGEEAKAKAPPAAPDDPALKRALEYLRKQADKK